MLILKLGEILQMAKKPAYEALVRLAQSLKNASKEVGENLWERYAGRLAHGAGDVAPKVEVDVTDILRAPVEQRPWVAIPSTRTGIPAGKIFESIEGNTRLNVRINEQTTEPLGKVIHRAVEQAVKENRGPVIPVPEAKVVLVATKPAPGEAADIELIRESIKKLAADVVSTRKEPVVVPLLGSGSGGLSRGRSAEIIEQAIREAVQGDETLKGKFVIALPPETPEIKKATAEVLSEAEKRAKQELIEKAPKVEKPALTATPLDLEKSVELAVRPVSPEGSVPQFIVKDHNVVRKLERALKSAGLEVTKTKTPYGEYSIKLPLRGVERQRKLQQFMLGLIKEDIGEMPDAEKVANIAARLTSSYGAVRDPLTEETIKHITDVSRQLAKYLPDDVVRELSAKGDITVKQEQAREIIDSVKKSIAEAIKKKPVLTNINEPMTADEIVQETQAVIVPYAYRYLYAWNTSPETVMQIAAKSAGDILRIAGYALKEVGDDMYRRVQIASAEDIAALTRRMKLPAPTETLIIGDAKNILRGIATEIAARLPEMSQQPAKPIAIPAKVMFDDRWYAMILKVHNIPKDVVRAANEGDLINRIASHVEDSLRAASRTRDIRSIRSKDEPRLPTVDFDVTVWPLRNVEDIIPRGLDNATSTDVMSDRLQQAVKMFSLRKPEIEARLHSLVIDKMYEVAGDVAKLETPERHVAARVLEVLAKPVPEEQSAQVRRIAKEARKMISTMLDHIETEPVGTLWPSRYRAAATNPEQQFARRVAVRAILDEVTASIPTKRVDLPEEVLRDLLARTGAEATEPGKDVRMIVKSLVAEARGKEISMARSMPASDVIRALLQTVEQAKAAPRWEEVRTDKIMAELKRYVYGMPISVSEIDRMLRVVFRDPTVYGNEIAKAFRDETIRGKVSAEDLKRLIRGPITVYGRVKQEDVVRIADSFVEGLKKELPTSKVAESAGRLVSAINQLSTEESVNLTLSERQAINSLAEALTKHFGKIITENETLQTVLRNAIKKNAEIIEAFREVERVMKEGTTLQSVVWPFPPSIFKTLGLVEPDTKLAMYELFRSSKAPGLYMIDHAEPTIFVFAKDPRLLQLYHIKRELDINKARFIQSWLEEWQKLWQGESPVTKRRIIDVIEGRMKPEMLSQHEKVKLEQYRALTAKLAEQTVDPNGNPIKHSIGSEIVYMPERWRRRVKWQIVAQDLSHPSERTTTNPRAWSYTLRAEIKLPRGRTQVVEKVVPIEEIDPRFLPDYFPHRFRGNWAVFYPHAHVESTRMAIFDNIEEAVEYILNNTSWDPNGRPFREVLEEMVREGKAKDIVDAVKKLGVEIGPRFIIADPFTIGLTPKQVGKISQLILQELKSRGLVDEKGIPAREIFDTILKAGVQLRAKFAPSKRVQATLPRTMNLSTYIGDPDEGFRIHIYQLASQMFSNEWRRVADTVLKDFYSNVVRPNLGNRRVEALWEFVNKWARDVDTYSPGNTEEWLNELFGKLGLGSATQFLREAAGWMSAIKLSNVVSVLVNLTQIIVTTYPTLGAKYTAKGLSEFFRYLATRDPQLEEILVKSGAKIYSSVFTLQPFLPTRVRGRTVPEIIRGMLLAPFTGAEAMNRGVTAMGAYYKALDKGIKDPITFARAVVDRTQGEYSRTGTSRIMRGTIPAFLFQFRKFFLTYLAFIHSLFRDIPVEAGRIDPKSVEALRFFIASIATGGVLSLPLVERIDRLVRRKTGVSPLDVVRERYPEIYDMFSRGVPMVLGVDLSSRIGIGRDIEQIADLIIRDYSIEDIARLSPWAGTVADVVSAAIDVATFQDDRAVDKFLSAVLPMGLWYIYMTEKQKTARAFDPRKMGFTAPSGYMTQPGVYSVRTGRLLVKEPDDDPLFWTKKMLGFRPYRESVVADAVERMLDLAHKYGSLKAVYERKILTAALSDNWDEVERLRQEALENHGITIEYDRITALQTNQQLDQLNRYFRREARELRERLESAVEETLGEEWEPEPTRQPVIRLPQAPRITTRLPSLRP